MVILFLQVGIVLPYNNTAYIDGLVQNCKNSIAKTLDLLQAFTKLSKYTQENTKMICTGDYKTAVMEL